jgi:hypothetical protein
VPARPPCRPPRAALASLLVSDVPPLTMDAAGALPSGMLRICRRRAYPTGMDPCTQQFHYLFLGSASISSSHPYHPSRLGSLSCSPPLYSSMSAIKIYQSAYSQPPAPPSSLVLSPYLAPCSLLLNLPSPSHPNFLVQFLFILFRFQFSPNSRSFSSLFLSSFFGSKCVRPI